MVRKRKWGDAAAVVSAGPRFQGAGKLAEEGGIQAPAPAWRASLCDVHVVCVCDRWEEAVTYTV